MNPPAAQDVPVHPAEVLRRLEDEARGRAGGLGLAALAPRITLRWQPRLRTTAGQARLDCALILLNPRLLSFPSELARTCLHELAHLVAHARNPRRIIDPHGPEWRQACRDLGLPGEKRCHTLPLARPRRVERRHIYHCAHCRREVARVRPFKRREACLACCREHAGGRYDGRFRFVPGHSPAARVEQAELFRL